MIPTVFSHFLEFSSIRKTLGLQSQDYLGTYEPSSALIVLTKQGGMFAPDQSYESVLHHELYHARQLTATTASFVLMTLLSLRRSIFENFVRVLNEKVEAGLWVPIKGWLDDRAPDSPHDWFNPEKEYYYISMMKRNIGIVDSLLFALGAFESKSHDDCLYWEGRFPWKEILPDRDGTWQWAFGRSLKREGWWPYGIISLLEASAFYFELLHKCSSLTATNKEIQSLIKKERDEIGEEAFRNSPIIAYYGPFLLCEEIGGSPPPFHLVPIAAFWSMNGPVPHVRLSESIKGRENSWKCAWGQFDPGILFYDILPEIIDDLGFESDQRSLLELAAKWKPVYWSTSSDNPIRLEQIIEEDLSYLHQLQSKGEEIGHSFKLVYRSIQFPDSLEKRLETYFTYPTDKISVPGIAIASPNVAQPSREHLELFVIQQLAEHLIPIWSFRSLPRFRFGKVFSCPSNDAPFDILCPAQGICNGQFPGFIGLPSNCWFQEIIKKILHLKPERIGIVPGEYGSEEEVRKHNW